MSPPLTKPKTQVEWLIEIHKHRGNVKGWYSCSFQRLVAMDFTPSTVGKT